MILHVTVILESNRLDYMVERLESYGMTVAAKLPVLGMITGTIPEESRASIEQLDGVKQVYVSRAVVAD